MSVHASGDTISTRLETGPSQYAALHEENEVGLRELVAVLRRRIWYFVGAVVPLTLLAVLVLSQLTPEYTAQSLILIEESNGTAMSVNSVVGGLSGDTETVQSEALVLSSQTLAERVVDKLNLDADPEFNPELRATDQSGFSFSGLIDRLLPGDQLPAGRNLAADPDLADALRSSTVVSEFQERLRVLPLEGTRVIELKFTSSRPQLAATIANLLAEEYLLSRIEAKYDSTKRASSWLSDRIDELRLEVDKTEHRIETLRQDYGLLQGDGLRLSSQELVELNTQLVMARTDRAEAEARLQQIRELLESPGGVDTAPEVLESGLIQRLREQQAQVERRVAELSAELGELHPRMQQLRAESRDLSNSIDLEVNKIVAGLENRAAAARTREASLARSVSQIKEEVGESNQRDIEVRALEREAEANRQLLATLLSRQKETLSQRDIDFQQADARIISPADIPVEPSYPNNGMVLLLVVFGSSFIGILLIMLVESLDGGYRSGEQIEADTGIASLGFSPRAPLKKLSAYEYCREQPGTAFAGAIQTLGWTLSLVFPGKYPQVILVTSSGASEGKTTTATCLADSLTSSGKRVLVIDADMRKPSLHEAVKVKRQPGLVDMLAKNASLRDTVQLTAVGSAVLAAGSPSPNPSNLIGSAEFQKVLADARSQYEIIIIDSPPVFAGADARLLATLADATVFVVHWSKTRRESVRHCLRQLDSAGAKLAGTFLTLVNVRKHKHYGYGDSEAYSDKMQKYYAR